jgi:hypothetical protein
MLVKLLCCCYFVCGVCVCVCVCSRSFRYNIKNAVINGEMAKKINGKKPLRIRGKKGKNIKRGETHSLPRK